MNKVITRKRYIIVRNGTHIMCGLAREYFFKPIDNIGDTQIKTYWTIVNKVDRKNRKIK